MVEVVVVSVGGGSTADVCLCLYATHRFVAMLQVLWKRSGPGHDGGSDQGLYRCVARNSVGALISRSARLRVASKCLLIVTYFAFCLGANLQPSGRRRNLRPLGQGKHAHGPTQSELERSHSCHDNQLERIQWPVSLLRLHSGCGV